LKIVNFTFNDAGPLIWEVDEDCILFGCISTVQAVLSLEPDLRWSNFVTITQNSVDEKFRLILPADFPHLSPTVLLNFQLLKGQKIYISGSGGQGLAQLFVEPTVSAVGGLASLV
jgi:hypothetical protein